MNAPGRYCLATCYCGGCSHYVPLPGLRGVDTKTAGDAVQAASWADREEPTWLDR